VKTKILSILVAMAILTLGIATTAAAAPAKAPPMEFQLYAGGKLCQVGWVGDSTVLADDVEVTWTSWGNQYKIFIAKGTEVTGCAGQQLYFLEVAITRYPAYNYIYLYPRDLKFSRQVVISQLVGESWSPILTFSTIQGGMAY
jgi:hypothetical protein